MSEPAQNPTKPIEVPANDLGAQFVNLLRVVLPLLGGIAIGRGWLQAGEIDAVTAVVLSLAPFVWGIVRVRLNHRRQLAMAKALPDTIARVAGDQPAAFIRVNHPGTTGTFYNPLDRRENR